MPNFSSFSLFSRQISGLLLPPNQFNCICDLIAVPSQSFYATATTFPLARGKPDDSIVMESDQPSNPAPPPLQTPACLILGMAGSGKTTLVDALSSWLEDEEDIASALSQLAVESQVSKTLTQSAQASSSSAVRNPLPGEGAYVVNLDPAVFQLPYEPNIDIRDTIKYKDVMREYSLGPNGAIITSLNIYATRFDQVIALIEKRAPEVKALIFDTPGQIETFTWSASGAIITESLAMVLPTVVVFVIDTQRSQSAMTFVSNMLYACSIMYKTRLPMVVAFNKIDVVSCKFAQAWMDDFDAFDAALKEDNFVGTLARSMAMALEEFYKSMRSVGVSAQTGEGMQELVQAVQLAAEEYEREYRPVLEQMKRTRAQEQRERQDEQIESLKRDIKNERESAFAPFDREEGDREEDDGRDAHAERSSQMKGAAEDDAEEKQAYEQFVRNMEEKSKKT